MILHLENRIDEEADSQWPLNQLLRNHTCRKKGLTDIVEYFYSPKSAGQWAYV